MSSIRQTLIANRRWEMREGNQSSVRSAMFIGRAHRGGQAPLGAACPICDYGDIHLSLLDLTPSSGKARVRRGSGRGARLDLKAAAQSAKHTKTEPVMSGPRLSYWVSASVAASLWHFVCFVYFVVPTAFSRLNHTDRLRDTTLPGPPVSLSRHCQDGRPASISYLLSSISCPFPS